MGRRYCIFDVETPNRCNDRISAIGVTVVQDGAIKNSFGHLVNPGAPFDGFNIHLTGISPALVENAPYFPQIWEQVSDLFSGSIVVAHNAAFDLSVLGKTLTAYGLPLPDIRYLDTLKLTGKALPELSCHKLNVVCDYYGIPLNHHQAESDSLACVQVLLRLSTDGILTNRTYAQYWKPKCKKPEKPKSLNPEKELLHLLEGVTEDGILTDDEAIDVNNWLAAHTELAGHYPFDRACSALQSALEDGVLERSELDALLSLFRDLENPELTECTADFLIGIDGKTACLSDEFEYGSRTEVTALLEACGAIVKTSVTRKLDYLVTGEYGSNAWIAGKYGTK